VQFYGRSGQGQHGLDIVERERAGSRSLYQVKRYQELSATKLREAVQEYSGSPRAADYDGPKRPFDPRRFVLVTSAKLDQDTRSVDELAKLQDEYEGDIQVDAWGAEALSRMLRDALTWSQRSSDRSGQGRFAVSTRRRQTYQGRSHLGSWKTQSRFSASIRWSQTP
jgi:hypothetical protein